MTPPSPPPVPDVTPRRPPPVPDFATGRLPPAPLVTLTHVTYGLHALGLAIGAFSATTIAGSFVFGWPSIIAVILNYVKREETRGTWLESHLAWQIRTFWFALAWVVAVGVVGLALLWVVIGFAILWIGFLVLGIWATYRIVRGWLALNEGRTLPLSG